MEMRILGLLCLVSYMNLIAYHPLHYVRFINPMETVLWIEIGTERGIFGRDKVAYRFKIPAKSFKLIPIKHPFLNRMTNTMQSPKPFFDRDLPEGSFVRSLTVQYGNDRSAKKIIAGQEEVRALNRCLELLKDNRSSTRDNGIQFLAPHSNISVPFACMMSGKATYEYGVEDPVEADLDVLSDSAENPDPFEHYIPSESEIGRPPRKTDPQRRIYQQDSQIEDDIQDLEPSF